MYYFSHARTALKFGIQSLGLSKGDQILIPDYICEVILHPLVQLGIRYQYYPLKGDLSPDWIELERKTIKESKAILMVHYFGQPQEIEKYIDFCTEHKLLLIEDNAHGYRGKIDDKLLGTFGDIGISSPRKILNTHSGGVLWLREEQARNFPSLQPNVVSLKQRVRRHVADRYPRSKKLMKSMLRNRPLYENPRTFRESKIGDYGVDSYSKNILELTDWNGLRARRRDRYLEWQAFAIAEDLKPVFNGIYPQCNPWCFPAYVKDQKEAIKWFEWGWQNDHTVFSWPSLPEDIIIEDGSAYDRWKKLICFEL
jgi:hypothetical protein